MDFKKTLLAVMLAICTSAPAIADEAVFVSDYKGRFVIKPTPKDSAIAVEFLKTGKNGYTREYLADPSKARFGKKVYQLYSCLACHGGNAGGLTGPDLTDDRYNNAKIATDRGMFEIISGGTSNGMSPRHAQVSGDPKLMTTDEILQVVAWLRTVYRGDSNNNYARWNP